MFIPHFYNAKSLPRKLVGFENGYEVASLYIYIYMQASYLLKSENHRDSSFSFIQGVDKIEKQHLYFLLLYHKSPIGKRLPMLLSLF
jgi:hypothetical protein